MLLAEIRIIEFPIGEMGDASFLFNLLLTIGLTREPKHRVKVKGKKKKQKIRKTAKYKEFTSMIYLIKSVIYLTKIMIIFRWF